MSYTVASINVNGIRAAYRRGMAQWIAQAEPDVMCLQEVRADAAIAEALLGDDWYVVSAESAVAGRAGVAIASRTPFVSTVSSLSPAFVDAGRWVEADLGSLYVISVYVHTGEAETDRQVEKFAFLQAMCDRLWQLHDEGRQVLICGDFNIAHRADDLKNWKGNLGKSGFLPDEQAVLDRLFEGGWSDVVRALHGPGPGPYSWWSWRGKAFDNDSGWRIDYQLASPKLAPLADRARIDRAPAYAARFSDHAPVVASYDLS